MNNIELINENGIIFASSRDIAEKFNKEHKKVTDKIESLIKEMSPKIALSMFIKNIYKDTMNRNQDEYLLTRDGFSLLVMGFTGKKALGWKLKYIDAFNNMEQALKEVNVDSYMIEDKFKRAEKWMQEQKITSLLEEQNKQLFETAQINKTIIDTMVSDKNLVSIFLVGKVLKSYNDTFGAKKIFRYLREKKILMDRKGTQLHNTPYDIHSSKFEIKLHGDNVITYFRKNGLNSFLNMIIREGLIKKVDKQSVLDDIEKELMVRK